MKNGSIIILFILSNLFCSAGNSIEFIQNRGQIADKNHQLRPDILFVGSSGQAGIFLRKTGISRVYQQSAQNQTPAKPITIRGLRLDINFMGSNPEPQVSEEQPTEDYFNYYYAHCPQGITHVKAFNKITYREVYSNIDFSFSGGKSQGFEYDMTVKTGGKVSDIRLNFEGTQNLQVSGHKLIVKTAMGELEEHIPKIYQIINGKEIIIEGGYSSPSLVPDRQSLMPGYEVSFLTGPYNHNYPLIIDPWWATYYGGSNSESGEAVATDPSGNILVTGSVTSTDFPITPGAFQTTLLSGGDPFVLKFTSAGTRIWATYFGDGQGFGITSDANSNVIITGATTATNFPVTAGAFQTTNQQTSFGFYTGSNAFLAKLDPTGARLWATYYGGDEATAGIAVTTDAANNILFTGYTDSQTLFPVSAGAFQTAVGGGNPVYNDAFVSKFDPNGNQIWGTYFGGNNDDRSNSVSVDNAGSVYISGYAGSTNFPVTAGAYQTSLSGGMYDVFVAKFTSAGARSWATYFGGTAEDGFRSAVKVDNAGNLALAGQTLSTDFPTTPGAYQPTNTTAPSTYYNSYVAKMSSAGTLLWSTYNNVSSEDGAGAVDVDKFDNVYVLDDIEVNSGYPAVPKASACSFGPAVNPGPGFGAVEDQHITKFNTNGKFICETFVGGSGEDEHEGPSKGMTVSNCRIIMTGLVRNGGFPTSPGAFQAVAPNTTNTVFLISLNSFSCGDTAPPLSYGSNIAASACGSVGNFRRTVCDSIDTLGVTFNWRFQSGNPSSATGIAVNGVTWSSAGTYNVTLTLKTCSGDTFQYSNTINVSSGGLSAAASSTPAGCSLNNGTATANPTGAGPFTYKWSGTGQTTATANNLAPGNYTVTVTEGGSCTTTASVTVGGGSAPAINSLTPSSPACSTGSGSATVSASGGTNPLTYSWSDGTNSFTGSSVSGLPSGTYTLTVTDHGGCSSTSAASIVVPAAVIAAATQSVAPTCGKSNGTASATASGGTGTMTYSWSNGSSGTTTSAADSITGLSPASYTITVTDGSGCTAITSANVIQDPLPLITISKDTSIMQGQSTKLIAGGGSGADTYLWSPSGSLSNPFIFNPIADPSVTTTYTLHISYGNNCSTEDSVKITVLELINCDTLSIKKTTFMPSAFSPNGDGQNDVLYFKVPQTSCIAMITLKIFDRWGELVFQTSSPSNGWDGVFRSQPMNAAVFVYYLSCTLTNGQTFQSKGNITLMR